MLFIRVVLKGFLQIAIEPTEMFKIFMVAVGISHCIKHDFSHGNKVQKVQKKLSLNLVDRHERVFAVNRKVDFHNKFKIKG